MTNSCNAWDVLIFLVNEIAESACRSAAKYGHVKAYEADRSRVTTVGIIIGGHSRLSNHQHPSSQAFKKGVFSFVRLTMGAANLNM
jgi:hypothetical protein